MLTKRHAGNHALIEKCQQLQTLIDGNTGAVSLVVSLERLGGQARLDALTAQTTDPSTNGHKLHDRLIDWYRQAYMCLQASGVSIPETARLSAKNQSALGL